MNYSLSTVLMSLQKENSIDYPFKLIQHLCKKIRSTPEYRLLKIGHSYWLGRFDLRVNILTLKYKKYYNVFHSSSFLIS